jgi:aspartokinase
MYFEEESINENGLLYTLVKKLNFNNINVLELVSNFTEVAFLINKKDFKKSLEVLLV